MVYRSPLDDHQKNLLVDLIEAEKSIPRERRQHFYVANTVGPPGVQLMHEGWKDTDRRVFEGDIETLGRAGLIALSADNTGLQQFYVTQAGHAFYADLMLQKGRPLQRVQNISREYLSSAAFQRKYPTAYAKWSQAEALLWSSDSAAAFTTIGHLAREAMQEFATALVERFQPTSVDADCAKIVSRIRAVLNTQSTSIGATEKPFLEALLAYWGTVSDLVQRQEHGAQREKQYLRWSDARRIVLQVAIIMFELDEVLSNSTDG